MKKAKLKNKKKFGFIKKLFLLLVFTSSFVFTICHYVRNNIDFKNEEYLNFLLDESYKNKSNYVFIVNNIVKLFLNIDTKNPSSFLTFSKNLKESSKIKNDIKEVYMDEDNYNPELFKKNTSYISSNSSNDVSDPILYIYNTHQLETYSNDGLSSTDMTPNVMMAASLLSEKLNKEGIKTIWEDTNMDEFIKTMGLPSNQLYGASRVFITNAREKHPTIKYYIDLHRDSVDKDISTININGVNYARVLFVLGTTNKTCEENGVMMNELHDSINKDYPKLSRGIYERETEDWYEAYNQDISKNAILIELGAKDNTINEVLNTIEVLSKKISDYIKKEN